MEVSQPRSELTQSTAIAAVHDVSHSMDSSSEVAGNKLQEQGLEALKDIVYGSTAGIVGKFIEYPFDTVKVRLQSQPDGLPLRYKGPLDCFKQSLRQDGFVGLYRGISAPLVGAAVETSSLFFSVRITTSFLPGERSNNNSTALPKTSSAEPSSPPQILFLSPL
jgi:hypothetical protein